ncbi:MAG: tetratricopeptide repeat protein [Candidatus Thermoplasmatota archaeon]|nr:tetratricopeptide repeat protein [Candidatus Thermoplasmatota archaeon]
MNKGDTTHSEAVQLLKEACSLYHEGRYSDMRCYAERCLKLDVSLGMAWELFGLGRLSELDLKDPLNGFERAIGCQGRAEDAEIALTIMRGPSWPKGNELLDAVNGLVALGQAYLSRSRFRPAALCFSSVERYVRPNPTIGSILGLIYRELGMLEISLDHYEKASLLEGAPIELLHDRAIILIKLGRVQEAEGLLGQLLEKIDDDPRIWNNYGTVLEALGKDSEALKAYDKALEIDDDYYPALYSRGRNLQKRGLMEEARPILERALDIEGRVFNIDDMTRPQEPPGSTTVRLKEVSTKRERKKSS